jgi:hypothetical protein
MEENNFIKEYQTGYFTLLEEFFEVFTGKSVDEFSTVHDISKNIRMFFLGLMDNIKGNKQRLQYVDMLEQKLNDFYGKYRDKALQFAGEKSCNKLLLSGGHAINLPQFHAIKVASLFSDMILVPDPVMPWFAEERKNEKFKLANILKEVFSLLKLKALSELNYETPQIFVIPLPEEVYEPERVVSPVTQAKYEVLVADFFHSYINKEICSYDAAIEYAEKNHEDFLDRADQHKLFVPPGRDPGLDIKVAIKKFKEDIREKRNKIEADAICSMSDQQLVLEGILESLWPQIYLLENLDRFHCGPLIPVETQAHYSWLCTRANIEKLVDSAVFSSETGAFIQSIKAHKFNFVADFSMESLLEMKKSTVFSQLQEKLIIATGRLNRAKFYELNKASADTLAEIYEILLGYEKEFKFINEKFKMNLTEKRIKGPDELEVSFGAGIAPFILNRLPFGPAKKLFVLKKDELREKQISARSFLGLSAKVL